MTSYRGKYFSLSVSLQQLPYLRLGPLEAFFELTQCPSRALNSPRASLPELQKNKDTIRCVAMDLEVSGGKEN